MGVRQITPTLICCLFLSYFRHVSSSCSNNEVTCISSDGRYGLCEQGRCVTVNAFTRDNLEFTITVRYPETELNGLGKHLYIRGSGLGLDWKRGQIIAKTSADTWSITIKYKSSDDGFRCQNCTNDKAIQHLLEYRIFVDDTSDMIGSNLAVKIPVSLTSTYFQQKQNVYVFPWFKIKTGTVTNFTVDSPEIGKTRQIGLYLPPSFMENSFKTYPRFFLLDGSPDMLFLFKPFMDNLIIDSGTSKEFIMIGFGDYTSEERFNFLTPTPGSFLNCKHGTFYDRCGNCLPENYTVAEYQRLMIEKCGKVDRYFGYGDNMLNFLLNTVTNKVQEITIGRSLTDQSNTGIIGYSLGGLMSCHAAWTRPNQFGMAACQSPSFWWPLNDTTYNDCNFDFFNVTLKNQTLLKDRNRQKILVDAGSEESHSPYRLTQSTVEAGLVMSKMPFFELDRNIWINIYPDAGHDFKQWSLRFWTALTTLIPPDGSPRIQMECRVNETNKILTTVATRSSQFPPIVG